MAAPEPIHTDLHRIAITGIVWKQDEDGTRRYLITKRAAHKKAWPGRWTVPGGGLETSDYLNTEATYQNSESPQWYNAVEAALRREIREEAGVEIENGQYLLDVCFIRPDGVPVLVLSFYAKYVSGEVTLDEDSDDFAWIAASDVASYELIQGIDHEIKMIEERLSV